MNTTCITSSCSAHRSEDIDKKVSGGESRRTLPHVMVKEIDNQGEDKSLVEIGDGNDDGDDDDIVFELEEDISFSGG